MAAASRIADQFHHLYEVIIIYARYALRKGKCLQKEVIHISLSRIVCQSYEEGIPHCLRGLSLCSSLTQQYRLPTAQPFPLQSEA